MKLTGTLLLCSLVAVALLAPVGFAQRQPSEKELLNELLLEVVNANRRPS